MNNEYKEFILQATGASQMQIVEVIQELWSGYGQIVRYKLEGCERKSIVIKHVQLPTDTNHPRGWNTDISHQRKVKSYKVEMAWYDKYSSLSDSMCRMPECIAQMSKDNEVLIVLEDLDSSGFAIRKNSVDFTDIELCLVWLANFHALYMGSASDNLWKVGTYWHLDTRPDELNELGDLQLKEVAKAVDLKLNSAHYKTLVHGDAKLANFCFADDGKGVSAVDFQYVGGGCGMKDVAYFIGSCLYEEDCEEYESKLLTIYFNALKKGLNRYGKSVDYNALEKEWRELYPYAWTDFHRFLKGWSPGHWKINSYSEKMSRGVIQQINY